MRAWLRIFVTLVVSVMVTSSRGEAQILYGSIVGNVTDATDAVIPGASVTITHKETSQSRTTTANAVGQYSFPTIATGTYIVKVTAQGFRTATQDDVVVTVNSQTRVNIRLELGAVTESVVVSASGLALQTDRAEVRAEVTETTLNNTPVPLGRNYQHLFMTLPGFSPPEDAHSIPSNPSRAIRFSVNGTSRSNNNTRIDGASSTNIWLPHMVAYVPALESIETVNVVTNSFDAEQGLAGGAAINVQIKSGTNSLHGSLFEYHMNQHLKAYPWVSDKTQPLPKYVYNQFGGTAGGPIRKNKLFYFVSYEGTREAQAASKFQTVPTAAMKAGDLSASPTPIYDPTTGSPDGSGRTPFPGNRIPPARIDPAVQKLIGTGLWPNPNRLGGGRFGLTNNYLAVGPTTFFRDTVDSKLNWNASEKLTAFVRFSVLDYRMSNPQTFGPLGGTYLHPTNSNPGKGFGQTYSGTVSATWVSRPNFVVDAYFGYTLMDSNVEQDRLDEKLGAEFLGIPGTNGPRRWEGGWPRFQIDGFSELGIPNDFMPYYRHDPQWQYVANANWNKSTHNIRFGFDFYVQHLNHNQPEFSGSGGNPAQGGFRFRQGTTQVRGGPSGNDFNAFASFLLGLPRDAGKIHQFPDDGYTTRAKFFSTYIRDQWQVHRKLTVTYGTRWEYFPFPTRADRGLERYDFDHNKILVCGVGIVPENCGIEVGKRHFAPRMGIAYRATNTFVIRAGYGITIDPFNWSRPLRTNYPIMAVQTLEAPNTFGWATTLRQGLPAVAPPDLGNGIIDIPRTAAVLTADPDNTRRGYIQSWNFTLEKELPGRWIAAAGYVATRSVNQMASLEQNWSQIGGGSAGRQMVQKFNRTAPTEMLASLGTAKYDSLQIRAERRFAGDYQIRVAYTWGHGRGYTAEDSGAGPNRVSIPQYYRMNYGRLSQDIRQNLQLTSIYSVPFGRGKRWATSGPAAAVLGGWQINALFSAYTGRPFTVSGSGTSINTPSVSQFADCLAPARKIGRPEQWYDPATFASVPTTEVRFGTCGVNSLDAPGLIRADAGIFRRFRIGERFTLQFRAEAFNLSNTPHFSAPNGSQTSSSFMTISSVRNTGREGLDERFFRVGLRLGW
jgi:hypothetical protein